MPWKEVKPMDAKVLFISDWLRKLYSFSDLCRKHGISRKTGYKWVYRYRGEQLGGLEDRSRKPKSSPNRVPYVIRKEIIGVRKRHPDWGPKKISAWLKSHNLSWEIPSNTTIYNILRLEALVAPRRYRRRVAPSARPFAPVDGPNMVWSADFKGQFCTGDGMLCYPLTVMDQSSRYLLACQSLCGTRHDDCRKVFDSLFRKHGLPDRIRTDNGVPFASTGVGGLSRLSIWWIKLGIIHERIEPGHPEQNGHHERMHRTLKKVAVKPPAPTLKEQQKRFDAFLKEYNEERPHESLGQNTPVSLYGPSGKSMPSEIAEIDYEAHFKPAFVNQNGCIVHKGRYVYIGYLLRGELVGMEEIGEGLWDVYFGYVRLGRFKEEGRGAQGTCTKLDRCYPCP